MTANRAARRREKRRRISVGENMVVTGTGERYAVDQLPGFAALPDKQPGEHRWIVVATYVGTNLGAPGPKIMDQNNLIGVASGCYDCEQPWSPALADQACPGEP